MTFGFERKAIETILTRRASGLKTETQEMSTVNMFNPEDRTNPARNTMKQVLGWFPDIGMFKSGLIVFYFVFAWLCSEWSAALPDSWWRGMVVDVTL